MILDSSALLAFLRAEPGGELVAAILPDCEMSLVNYAEVIARYSRSGAPTDGAKRIIADLPLRLVAPDLDQAYTAGILEARTRSAGLSMGDRFCLALAISRNATVWTADRAWAEIAGTVGVEVRLIR